MPLRCCTLGPTSTVVVSAEFFYMCSINLEYVKDNNKYF